MAESSCFAARFSPPLHRNPSKALTESISFGRYASESLAWEKWSAFTSNRCLEEVAQLSKAVSVSERKAFFEAHFKKRAIMKAAAVDEKLATSILVNSHQSLNFPDVTSDDGMFAHSVKQEMCSEAPESRINIDEHPSIHARDLKDSDINEKITFANDFETKEDDEACIFDKVIVTNVVAPNEENICENLGAETLDGAPKDSTCTEFNNKENLVSSEQKRHDLNEVVVSSGYKSKIRKEWDKRHKSEYISALSSISSVDSRVHMMNKSLNLPKFSSDKSFLPAQKRLTTASNANKSKIIETPSSVGPVNSRIHMNKSLNLPKVSSSKSFSQTLKYGTKTLYANKSKDISMLSSVGAVVSRVYVSKPQNLPKASLNKSFSPIPKCEATASYINKTPNRCKNFPSTSMDTSTRFSSLSNKAPSFSTNSIQLPIKSKPSSYTPRKSSSPSRPDNKSKLIPSTISTPFRFRSEERAAARNERLGKKLMADDNKMENSLAPLNHKNLKMYISTKTTSKTSGKIQSLGKLLKS